MKTESKVRYEQAAYVYIGGKFLIALLVFFYACSSCQDFGRYIFYTALRTFLLGHFIYMGFRSTIKILTVMNAAKAIFYIFDFSTSMAIVFPVPSLFNTQWILSSPGRGNPVLILTALLTGIVVFGLARAVWNPAFKGWESSDLFRSFRDLKLEGKCGRCDFRLLCGGCRARAYASTGSYLKEDPWCIHLPPEGEPRPVAPATEDRYWREEDCLLAWTPEAKERLKRIPFFARHMAVKAIERYAKKNNIRKVTPEIMQKSKGRGHHSGSMEQWGKG